jgi:hypothetical protein
MQLFLFYNNLATMIHPGLLEILPVTVEAITKCGINSCEDMRRLIHAIFAEYMDAEGTYGELSYGPVYRWLTIASRCVDALLSPQLSHETWMMKNEQQQSILREIDLWGMKQNGLEDIVDGIVTVSECLATL